jgi:copper resistance protein B
MRDLPILLAAAVSIGLATPVLAQDHAHSTGHAQAGAVPTAASVTPAPDAQGPNPVPVLTDADRAAAFPLLSRSHTDHGSAINSLVLVDRLETSTGDADQQAWAATAWIGGDIQRLWLKTEGQVDDGDVTSARVEALYGRAVSAWWDVVAGVRQDLGPGDDRTWAAIGVQGMAPYMFEVSAMTYVGSGGQVRADIEVEYEALITNRLILQPSVGLSLQSDADEARRIGAGLGDVELGLRLRYEIRREFAPYIGLTYERALGDTADLRRIHQEDVGETRLVAGLRLWF